VLRNKDKWARYRKKRHNTNPVRGPYHFRAPSKMFFRVVKGMIPAKTFRGKQALARLASFEGVPDDFSKMKRMVVPDALQVLVSKTYRKTTVLGTLASEVGWKHGDLIKKLEAARIAKNAEFYAAKKADAKATAAAEASVPAAINAELASFGYHIEPTAPGAMKALKEEFATTLEASE
jgi:large subunit ribosomal protein L13Ae